MIEAGWLDVIDELWVIAVPRDLAIERLMARNSLSEVDAIKRIDAQMSQDEKLEFADKVLWNSTSLERLQKNIDPVSLHLHSSFFQSQYIHALHIRIHRITSGVAERWFSFSL